MTKHFRLPDGYVISVHVWEDHPPILEKGWRRVAMGKFWCVDEEVIKEVGEENNRWDWVDKRTSE